MVLKNRVILRWLAALSAAACYASSAQASRAACVGPEELERVVGDQVRGGVFAIDASALGDRPMCSGITVAQAIQDLHEKYFPTPVQPREAYREPVPIPRPRALSPPSAPRTSAPATEVPSAAGPALTRKLNALVQADSRGWMFNSYDAGSMRNVEIVEGSVGSGHYVMRGDYTYNGGTSGWVIARMSGPNLDCIQFHDSAIGCRALRTAEQGNAMRAAVVGGVANAFSDDSGGSGESGDCRDIPVPDGDGNYRGQQRRICN